MRNRNGSLSDTSNASRSHVLQFLNEEILVKSKTNIITIKIDNSNDVDENVCYFTMCFAVIRLCNTFESFLTCSVPSKRKYKQKIDNNCVLCTHICSVKGNPSISNFSTSKSTPIVAL